MQIKSFGEKRKLVWVGKDRSYWVDACTFFTLHIQGACIKCCQESRSNTLFLQFYVLKLRFSLCQIQKFIPDNLDTEPDGPILYRKDQFI